MPLSWSSLFIISQDSPTFVNELCMQWMFIVTFHPFILISFLYTPSNIPSDALTNECINDTNNVFSTTFVVLSVFALKNTQRSLSYSTYINITSNQMSCDFLCILKIK